MVGSATEAGGTGATPASLVTCGTSENSSSSGRDSTSASEGESDVGGGDAKSMAKYRRIAVTRNAAVTFRSFLNGVLPGLAGARLPPMGCWCLFNSSCYPGTLVER